MNIGTKDFGADRGVLQGLPPAPKPRSSRGTLSVLLVERRQLARDSLAQHIASRGRDMRVSAASTAEEAVSCPGADVIILGISASAPDAPEVSAAIATLRAALPEVPLALLGDGNAGGLAATVLGLGLRGYIPSDLGIDVMLAVLRLLAVGGTFLPVEALVAPGSGHGESDGRTALRHHFSHRQTEVLEALRQGKPNKIIAHELGMSESTVKVHVRSILKKLNASNRTQVAYLVQQRLALPLPTGTE